mmetsp:Transcript_96478/g.191131  ORF Transcript_96478/g.191131 Transcript_96478/m.191131 type:complete len:674 (+) Transcript_96478:110-2131(+)|eukprot:CAMPEP_0172865292 /NCGR_PEP_ID=MMETSP1075-20121228/81319_1 /TAXON_ID=2916 /ORGANISM="Ceratium fusus, Strain PA161109" /LENGTH=673 /DNA_ID=CAMNT_0013714311 /DNA_START=104 /DNA_END=2125 /DNA_ORIENTATION=-
MTDDDSIGVERKKALAALVADGLHDWRDRERCKIQVEAKNGEGQLFTYKVSLEGADPPAVALHCWNEDATLDAILKPRTGAAAAIFAEAGLAPRRLVQGDDWFAETWEGLGHPVFDTAERLKALGVLVARIHDIPTDWFDEWRERLRERRPELRKLPPGSHFWWWSAREELLCNVDATCLQAFCEAQWFAPTSEAACRLVTAHADLHPGNMLKGTDGISVIDFEYTCVTYALQDLSFVVTESCGGDRARKWVFLQSYLQACGFPTTDKDVEALLFDCEVGVMGSHFGPLDLETAESEPEAWLAKAELYEALVTEARSQPHLRHQIMERGLVRYVKDRKFCRAGSPVTLCDLHNAVSQRLTLNEDGTISPEALRSLVLGAGDGGSITLVPRADEKRRLVFETRQELHYVASNGVIPIGPVDSHPAALSQQQETNHACVCQLKLVLASHPGHGLTVGTLRKVGTMSVESISLGPVDEGIPLVYDRFFVQRQDAVGRAVYLGDAVEEWNRKQNEQLYHATQRGDCAIMKAIIAVRADVNWEREDESLGHVAARKGHLEALQVLLQHGFDVNTEASFGGSALIEAATYGHISCVRRLLEVQGIDFTLTEDDKTALQWARDPAPNAPATPAHLQVAELLEAAEQAKAAEQVTTAIGEEQAPAADVNPPIQVGYGAPTS